VIRHLLPERERESCGTAFPGRQDGLERPSYMPSVCRRAMAGLVACLVFGSVWPATAQSPVRFRFSKALDRAAAQDDEIVAFCLDSDVYAATRAGFPDLRVFDEAGAEAPYQLELDVEFREERTRQDMAPKVVSLREDGNMIEVRLRLPENSPNAAGLNIVTPQRNYERKVQVFGSQDGADWTPLVPDGIIFDYSRYMDVSNREIALPANSFRQFKLSIGDVTDEKESPYKELTRTFRSGKVEQRVERTEIEKRTFRIDRIVAWHDVLRQRVRTIKTVAYPVAEFDSKEDAEKKLTILSVRTRREPISRFTLETPSRNFYRQAVVEVPVVKGVNREWRRIGEATLSNFRFRSHHREQLTIAFPEQREETYRIVLHNEDNPTLGITGVKAEGNIHRVVFLAEPSKAYRVVYGSETAEAPKYEAGAVLAALRREDFQPVEAQLGAQVANTEFGGEPGLAVRKLLNNWFFLGGVICLMVVVLGWSLFRAGRHLESLPKDPC
jgi:hypothetical protein